jgi:hypothetical protein
VSQQASASASGRQRSKPGQYGGKFGYREPFTKSGDEASDDEPSDESEEAQVESPSSSEVDVDAELEADDNDDDNDDDDDSEIEEIVPARTKKRGRKGSAAAAVKGQKKHRSSTSDEEEDDEDDKESSSEESDEVDNHRKRTKNRRDVERRAPRRQKSSRSKSYRAASATERSRRGSQNPPQQREEPARRTSSRANKYRASMAEPNGKGDDALMYAEDAYDDNKPSRRRTKSDDSDEGDGDGMDSGNDSRHHGKQRHNSKNLPSVKSPAKRHARQRLSIRSDAGPSSSDDEWNGPAANGSSSESSGSGRKSKKQQFLSKSETPSRRRTEAEFEDEEEPLEILRILACRTETQARWREICKGMQTSEIDNGSRWDQPPDSSSNQDDSQVYEERFLVKWKDLGYLHCSWETQADLEGQVEMGKQQLTRFFRKSQNGLLYDADERCDGDYFDPGWVQIDRILEVHLPEDGGDYPAVTAESEDAHRPEDFGIVFDKSDERYEEGTGRQFLIKWVNLGYTEATYEFERDLILNDVEYKSHVKVYLKRTAKPHKSEIRDAVKKGEGLRRQLYKTFGDNSPIEQSMRDVEVEKFKADLQSEAHKNGGQLRDYQAEGVTWMISNYVNRRSFILADEMGLYVLTLRKDVDPDQTFSLVMTLFALYPLSLTCTIATGERRCRPQRSSILSRREPVD